MNSDLELRLLQTFAAYAGHQLVDAYLAVKNTSRVTKFLGSTTETLLTVTGVTAVVRFLFSQYQRVGGPLLGYMDEAMGRRIIDSVVSVLLLAVEEDHEHEKVLALESGGSVKLSREERLQAMLRGEVPRLKALVDAAYRRGHEAGVASTPEPLVMELKDFVPIDELARVKDANREHVRELSHEMTALKSAMSELNKEKQRLEQRLIDVYNYRESERGQRFQEMEVRSSGCWEILEIAEVNLWMVVVSRRSWREPSWRPTKRLTTFAALSWCSRRCARSARARAADPANPQR